MPDENLPILEYTEIVICNQALIRVGEEVIRTFNEPNKRSAVCRNSYIYARDMMLSRHDWSFARKHDYLTQLDETGYLPYVYSMPNDCFTPLEVFPRSRHMKWRVHNKRLEVSTPCAQLMYTRKETDVSRFTMPFINCLVSFISFHIAPSLTKQKELTQVLRDEYNTVWAESIQEDAERGSEYRESMEDPNQDTFVDPGAHGYDVMGSGIIHGHQGYLYHDHPWDQDCGIPSTPPAVGDSPMTTVPPHNHPEYALVSHQHSYSDLTGIPTEFPPEAHVHDWVDITDKPATFAPANHLWDGTHSDVVITTPTRGDIIAYDEDNGKWINFSITNQEDGKRPAYALAGADTVPFGITSPAIINPPWTLNDNRDVVLTGDGQFTVSMASHDPIPASVLIQMDALLGIEGPETGIISIAFNGVLVPGTGIAFDISSQTGNAIITVPLLFRVITGIPFDIGLFLETGGTVNFNTAYITLLAHPDGAV